nr:AMIN domain-containing protein [Selenomonadaceae bacterium]
MIFSNRLLRRVAGFTLALFFFLSSSALAASASITGVRFGKGTDHDRIVLDVSEIPKYTAKTENDGKRIILELSNIGDSAKVKPIIHSDVVHRVYFTKLKNSVVLTIDLTEPAEFVVKTLKNPNRIFVDIQKEYEHEQKSEPAPGLVETVYTRRDGRGRFRAFLLDVDLKKYDLVPVLANGEVLGRTTVSRMSDEVNAAAAINSNYFASSGEILGVLRMGGTVVGTTYFTRSALGVRTDGTPFVDQVYYSGKMTIGKKSAYVSGVNAERGADTLIIYNRAYDVRTNTNEYGREFVVQN